MNLDIALSSIIQQVPNICWYLVFFCVLLWGRYYIRGGLIWTWLSPSIECGMKWSLQNSILRASREFMQIDRFYTRRSIKVAVDGPYSEYTPVNAGIP